MNRIFEIHGATKSGQFETWRCETMTTEYRDRIRSLVTYATVFATFFLRQTGAWADDIKIEGRWMEKAGKEKKYSKPRPAGTKIDMVVIHFSSAVVKDLKNPFAVNKVIELYKASSSSAHYLMDRGGKVYHLVPDARQAFHAGAGSVPANKKMGSRQNELNKSSIGIELLAIGTQDEMKKYLTAEQYKKISKEHLGYTSSQYSNLKKLLKYLEKNYKDLKYDRNHIIGHDEYAPKRKVDPGALFEWSKIGL